MNHKESGKKIRYGNHNRLRRTARALLLVFAAVFGMLAAGSFGGFSKTVYAAQGVYVYDEADLLSAEQEALLSAEAKRLTETYGCGVYIHITPDMYAHGYSFIENYAEYFYDKESLGVGSDRNMILLAMSMAERDFDLDAHGTIGNSAFTDYAKQRLQDKFLPYFRENDWYGGYDAYLKQCDYILSENAAGTPVDVNHDPQKKQEGLPGRIGIGAAVSALLSALGVGGGFVSQHKNVRTASQADTYAEGGLKLSARSDRFTHRTETRTKIERDSDSGGGGGTSIGGGGHSHSSGKF